MYTAGIGGATPKLLEVQICCPQPTFYRQRPIIHNTGIGDKQKSRLLYLLPVIDYYNERGVHAKTYVKHLIKLIITVCLLN